MTLPVGSLGISNEFLEEENFYVLNDPSKAKDQIGEFKGVFRLSVEINFCDPWYTATAICGNDILGSCFYTVGVTFTAAGHWAPVALLLGMAVSMPLPSCAS